MRRVVVLRPEPGASETVRKASALGLDAVAVPLFAVHAVDWIVPDLGEFDALLLTSANSIRHGGKQLGRLRTLRVHAVGAATAEAARAAGFRIASVGEEGVDRLLSSIKPGARLLHLCGEDRKSPASASQEIHAVVAYRASAVEGTPGLEQAGNSIVLVHSPRAARHFGELAEALGLDRSTITIAAISAEAAIAAGHGWALVKVAERPSDDALLALAASLCEKGAGTISAGA